jgi:hypothetical protein
VDAGYFGLMKIPLVRGRSLVAGADDRQAVAVVNREFVSRYAGGRDPVGQRFYGPDGWRQIVGVLGNTVEVGKVVGRFRWRGLEGSTAPWVYVPFGQGRLPTALVVRAAGDSRTVIESIRRQTKALGQELSNRTGRHPG